MEKIESNNSQYFEHSDCANTLKKKSAQGGLVSIAGQIIRFAIQLITTAILARLLTPTEFGIFAMGAMLVGLMKLFSSQFLSIGIVQHKQIDHRQISAFYWINCFFTIALVVVTAVLAPLAAAYYREPQVTTISWVLSSQIIFAGIAMTHIAIMTRQMRFISLTRIDIAAGFCSKLIGIVFAWVTASYWALLAIPVSYDFIRLVMVWWACRWRPSFVLWDSGLKSLLNFGSKITVSSVALYLSENIDSFVVGRVWGAQVMGIYSKGYSVLLMPIRLVSWPIGSVVVSALSKLHNNKIELDRYYRVLCEIYFLVMVPMISFLMVAAKEMILVILGPQWIESVIIFQALGLSTLFGSMTHPLQWLLLSKGKGSIILVLIILDLIVKVIAVFMGISWGPQGVAWSISCAMAFLMPMKIFVSCKNIGHNGIEYMLRSWRPVLASLVCGIIIYYSTPLLSSFCVYPIVLLSLQFILFIIGYLFVMILLPNGMNNCLSLIQFLRTQ